MTNRANSNNQTPEQRLRIKFAKGEALKYISHLDLAKTWERVFRRAGLPLAYSQGFNPRPRFQIASALPVSVAGCAELMDVWLAEPLLPEDVLSRLQPMLPAGLEVLGAEEVGLRSPSLQSQMRVADYRAVVSSCEPSEAIATRVQSLLEAATLLRQRHHKGRLKTYDLRPLIRTVRVEPGGDGEHILYMRLQASPQGAGRPDEVLDALGLSAVPHIMERTELHFEFDK
ncbi:MAG: TIGR03936 family radical SAM-associated protein [Anaerolineae bacterium]|jgi:radical SAM-linked protein